jgi:alpha-mannosidase
MRFSKPSVIRAAAALAALAVSGPLLAADPPEAPGPAAHPVDYAHQPTLYAVGYAHLDTQWRWSYPQVVRQFLANTLHANPPLIDKYPHYIFNFTGARRYQLMKEYFPADYERMKGYIKAGRWFPGGSNVDETDQNVPSAESVVRHVLYANHFFKREFGVCGVDFMVPDCFGFPASLPTVLAHCGIKGFHTQKLTWGYAGGPPPFKVGVWEGVDGEGVVAALDPTGYGSNIDDDLSHDPTWIKRAQASGKQSDGLQVDYRYYGIGDRGGSPSEASVRNLEKSVTGDGPLHVISATSDQMFRDITPEQRAKLPVYKGDLLLTGHSAGSITSQGYMKRWNRKNELLATAAERASVAAAWLGGAPYPTQKLYDSWMLLLECQMHDILPGDCLPVCYNYSWNDEVLAANGFAAAETDGVGAVAAAMDTSGGGVPLVVYNPLSVDRQDPVEATVAFPGTAPASVTVTGPDGKPCPAQVLDRDGDRTLRILFLARVPGTAFATFNVRPAEAADAETSPLKVTPNSLENARYRVTLNAAGDVEQVVDKADGSTRLLSAPLRLGFLHQNPVAWPAWNMDWSDRRRECQEYVGGPATVRIVERGPVRVALEITRQARGCTFTQRVQLSAGTAGDRVEFPTHINWRATECSLEAVIPMTVAAPTATYDTQVGVTVRANNNPAKFEVPQQQWLDVTAPDGRYGESVLNDCKYGSDKPDDHTVRLTLLYTPGVRGGYQDEASQDWGTHDMTFALEGHAGDWRAGHTVDQAARLNQPLAAFQSPAHAGPLGRQFALLSVSNPAVVVQAVKKAEDSDEIIVRLKETADQPADGVTISFAGPVVAAREVDGQEAEIGKATIRDGKLVTDVKPFHLKAFAIRLAAPAQPAVAVAGTPVALPFDQDAVTPESNLQGGSFDGDGGHSYPAEQWPAEVTSEGIRFQMGPATDGAKNAVACHGQVLPLPAGTRRAYLLAAAANGDAAVQIRAGDRATDLTVQDWGGYIGQWDNRLWKGHVSELTYDWSNRLDGLVPGYIKRDTVAWHADHRHGVRTGNEIWSYCYLFKYGIDVPAGATTLTLPDDPKVRVFAVTAASAAHEDVTPARPLYDTLADHVADQPPRVMVEGEAAAADAPAAAYHDTVMVRLDQPLYYRDGSLHYTTDGSDPTAGSSTYTGPLAVSAATTIKAREFDAAGRGSPVAARTVDVNDTTPPTIVSTEAIVGQPGVRLTFSEPVAKASAERPENYRFDPPLKVASASLLPDGRSVRLTLADPLPATVGTTGGTARYRLTVTGVTDVSPAANAIRGATVPLALAEPVVKVDSYSSASGDPLAKPAPGLHRRAGEPWSINCFVNPTAEPTGMVVIAGFGTCTDGTAGVGRYLCKFPGGIHYWSCNADLDTNSRLEVGRWQMLSAVYDGQTVTLYKDGRPIAHGEVGVGDDRDTTVRVAPVDPWSKQHRFEGDVQDLTVWNVALPEQTLRTLWTSRKHN